MEGEYDARDLIKGKINDGTESIKHCTATAEWHGVSNVVWQQDRFVRHRDRGKTC